jgi:hypothetical protein
MPRFVILEHDHPYLHWDLMLEVGDRLRTWRLAQPPEQDKTISATFLADHRRLYLDYEGPLSGDRGRVVRWDAGSFAWETEERDAIEVILEGRRACGRARLARVQGDEWGFILF